jgi:histidine triad (HIT) family protein
VTDCLFCGIALGEVPADIVMQNEHIVAFRDIQPQAPVHVLVIPRKHISGLAATSDDEVSELGLVLRAVTRVAELEGVAGTGFRTVFNTGVDAQQTVQHLHAHVIGGRGMGWPPG